MSGWGDSSAPTPGWEGDAVASSGWENAPSQKNDENATLPMVVPNPQEKGWTAKERLDYVSLVDEKAVDSQYWGHARAKYDYIPEDGEFIGPRIEELEQQLFSFEHKVQVGEHMHHVQEVKVACEGPERIVPIDKFDDAGLHAIVLESLKLSRYLYPTPVQQYTIPAVLKGFDVVAVAQTGSGKTGAYLIPVLSNLMGKAKKLAKPRPNPTRYNAKTDAICAEPLVLVICPTRELAIQIFDEARRLCYRSMLRPCVAYGGGPRKDQLEDLKRGADILIGTPGRLKDFLECSAQWLSLRRVQYTILDEADEMLKSNWEREMSCMLGGGSSQTSGQHQYMFFSATFQKTARAAARNYLQDEHLSIKVGRSGSVPKNVIQEIVWVEEELKEKALLDLILSEAPCRTLIFTNANVKTDRLDDLLYNHDFPVTSMNSHRTQREREDAINAFKSGKCPIMVATAINSRGIDVINVMHIINYDIPSADHGGINEYTHRIGRTARMGNLGKATSFYNNRNTDVAEQLCKVLMEAEQKVPDFLQEYKPENLTWDSDNSDEYVGEKNTGDDGWGASVPGASSGGGWGTAEPAASSAPEASSGDNWATPANAAANSGGSWASGNALGNGSSPASRVTQKASDVVW